MGLTLPLDLSMVDVNGNPRQTRETANCYVCRVGRYKFPLVYGNGIKNGIINTDAFTDMFPNDPNTCSFYNYLNEVIASPFIETDTGHQASSASVYWREEGASISNVMLVDGDICRYVQFDVLSAPSDGSNALICVKDADGVVMWSWHIWLVPEIISALDFDEFPDPRDPHFKLMDRDLGAVRRNDITQGYTESPTYQWGRKDPIPRYGAVLSGEVTSVEFNEIDPYNAYDEYGDFTHRSGIRHPELFSELGPYSWMWLWGGYTPPYMNGSKCMMNMWDGSSNQCHSVQRGTFPAIAPMETIKTIYDPCPVGWRVPSSSYSVIVCDEYYPWHSEYRNFFPHWNYYENEPTRTHRWYELTKAVEHWLQPVLTIIPISGIYDGSTYYNFRRTEMTAHIHSYYENYAVFHNSFTINGGSLLDHCYRTDMNLAGTIRPLADE